MEDKIYIILDEEKQMYCYIILSSLLEDLEIAEFIKTLYYNLLDEAEDFSDTFSKEVMKIKDIKVKSIVYKDIKYICV